MTEVRREFDKLCQEKLGVSLDTTLKVIALLEMLRTALGDNGVYVQRIFGLANATEHEDVMDCKYVQRALLDSLTNRGDRWDAVKELVQEVEKELCKEKTL